MQGFKKRSKGDDTGCNFIVFDVFLRLSLYQSHMIAIICNIRKRDLKTLLLYVTLYASICLLIL